MFRFFCYRYPGAAVTRGGVNVVNEVVCGVEVRGTFEECGGFGAGRTARRGWPMASASTSHLLPPTSMSSVATCILGAGAVMCAWTVGIVSPRS